MKINAKGVAKSQCAKCQSSQHKTSECRSGSTLGEVNNISFEEEQVNAVSGFPSDKDREEAYKKAEERFGKCPVCNLHHTYQRKVGQETFEWPSCRLSGCEKFKKLSAKEKGAVIEAKRGCPRCLSWLHSKIDNRIRTVSKMIFGTEILGRER